MEPFDSPGQYRTAMWRLAASYSLQLEHVQHGSTDVQLFYFFFLALALEKVSMVLQVSLKAPEQFSLAAVTVPTGRL